VSVKRKPQDMALPIPAVVLQLTLSRLSAYEAYFGRTSANAGAWSLGSLLNHLRGFTASTIATFR